MQKISINPINSLLFISDPDGGTPPQPVHGAMILATPSCISFGCYPEQDGPTEIVLGDGRDVDPGNTPDFDGELDTPKREVVITTVDFLSVLRADAFTSRTRVRIWLSHPRWPEKVIVGLN